jgi:hypothetical protein
VRTSPDDIVRHSLWKNPAWVAQALDMTEGMRRQTGGGVMTKCPWHAEDTPSLSIRLCRDGIVMAHCFGCGESGTVLALVATRNGLNNYGEDFQKVLEIASEMVGGDVPRLGLFHRSPVPPPEYPPRDEVAFLWQSTEACSSQMSGWLSSRGLDPFHPGVRWLGPAAAWLPDWCKSWTASDHRVLIPLYDSDGIMRSVRARCVDQNNKRKELAPTGFSAQGLVMANPEALSLMRNAELAGDVVISEGGPDFLTMYGKPHTAVFGIFSGSWSHGLARQLHGATVEVRTHLDKAGEKYYQEIANSLPLGGGTTVVRSTLEHGYKDDNEALQHGWRPW